MGSVLRLAIVDPNDGSREVLKKLLLGMESIWLEAECSRYEFFPDVVQQTEPDVGIVALDNQPQKGLELIQRLSQESPACSVLVLSSVSDGQLILSAMRAGAKEFLPAPFKAEDVASALDRIDRQRIGGRIGKSRNCSIFAIAGASGGVGTTSLAVNLGCALASNPDNSVVLIDLDLSLGDADVFLDAIPDYTLSDVAQNIKRLDFTLLKRSLTKHASGLYLLPRPVQLQDMGLITPDDLRRVFGLLKASFSHLVVDLSKRYSELDLLAAEEATQVLLVTQLDLPCLRNVVRLMSSFEELEGLKDKIRIVVNRVGLDSGQISLKKAQETIGAEVFWQVPNDYRLMVEVRNNGVPLVTQAPRSAITQSIVSLARALDGTVLEEQPGDKSGLGRWLSFLPKKAKSDPPREKQPT